MATASERLISDMRGVRYGEVLAVFERDGSFEAEVYGTQMLNDCPPELWDQLDATTIAGELGALIVKLNGPRHWMLDGLGTKVAPVEPVLREFDGLLMRRIAILDLGNNPAQIPYTIRHVDRGAIFYFDEGRPVHELVDPDGLAYVLQAYCIGVDPTVHHAIYRVDSRGEDGRGAERGGFGGQHGCGRTDPAGTIRFLPDPARLLNI